MTAPHGRPLRGLDAAARSSVDQGRFGRLFRSLPPAGHSEDALRELAASMLQNEPNDEPITVADPGDENPTIPAGYTYLGQFIDHDITFDPVSVPQAVNDPDALFDFRTPRLDLDSIYGRGPADQPYLYDKADPQRLLLGVERHAPSGTSARPDLPRNGQDVALVGDPRNDENRIVSQIQALFLRFHNRMLATVPNTIGEAAQFARAQQLTRWHYQWVVVHDFLPRIVGAATVGSILAQPGAPPKLTIFTPPRREPFMPVEFSVAAYRFGHSMVRPSYSLNSDVLSGSDPGKHRVPIFSDNTDPRANLNGFASLPDEWGIDWAFFFPDLPAPPANKPDQSPYQPAPDQPFLIPQPSYRIDTVLVDPLATLPGPPVVAGPSGVQTRSLAERNLQRGRALQLPSGQAVAKRLGLAPLGDDVIWDHADPDRKAKRQEILRAFPEFADNAPLWFYLLKEAELTKRDGFNDPANLGGHHLGPVGGHVVAEVLLGLLWYDHHSYLYQDPLWQPEPPVAPAAGQFAMSDLIEFTDS